MQLTIPSHITFGPLHYISIHYMTSTICENIHLDKFLPYAASNMTEDYEEGEEAGAVEEEDAGEGGEKGEGRDAGKGEEM